MMSAKRGVARAGALLVVLAVWGCESSDQIAPEGSTILLNANPATIVLVNGVQDSLSPVDILATVTNSIGVPLPEQDLRFTTTSGVLDPPALTPVSTDDSGTAKVVLTGATQGPTITARSGKISAMLTIQTATCALGSITLSPSLVDFDSCDDTPTISVVARDTASKPCVGISIKFEQVPTSTPPPATDVSISFTDTFKPTDNNGNATTTLRISDCSTKCAGDDQGIPKECTGLIRASSGTIKSDVVPIDDQVP
jgi:hypothetical protein